MTTPKVLGQEEAFMIFACELKNYQLDSIFIVPKIANLYTQTKRLSSPYSDLMQEN